jgi:hypothetical protein
MRFFDTSAEEFRLDPRIELHPVDALRGLASNLGADLRGCCYCDPRDELVHIPPGISIIRLAVNIRGPRTLPAAIRSRRPVPTCGGPAGLRIVVIPNARRVAARLASSSAGI